MAGSLDFSKAEYRAEALRRRDALSLAARGELDRAILGQLMAGMEFRTAGSVIAYWGIGSEIDTRPLLREIQASGRRLAMPKVNRKAGVMDVYEVKNLETDLMAGVWSIHEPDPERCEIVRPAEWDLVVVPGVAFDFQGGRIGYGKGYYDGFLARCPARKVAAAYACQVFDRVPMEAHDVRVDEVITE